MKRFTKIILPVLTFVFLFGSAFSQKKKHKHDHDAVVTIRIDYDVPHISGCGARERPPAAFDCVALRRRNFADFAKAVRAAGRASTCRSRLLEKRSDPDHRIRQQIEHQRLQLVVMKRTPKAKTRAAAPARRRLRLNNSGNFPA